MDIGRVTGNIWATKKDENLNGHKLLVVKILESYGKEQGRLIVASDIVGAGIGDTVLIAHGGAARIAIGNQKSPVDVAIVGIVDSVEADKSE